MDSVLITATQITANIIAEVCMSGLVCSYDSNIPVLLQINTEGFLLCFFFFLQALYFPSLCTL